MPGLIFISEKFGQYSNMKKVFPMGSSLSPVMTNIYINYISLRKSLINTKVCLRCVDDTFIHWTHWEPVQIVLEHINSVSPSIWFTIKAEK